MNEHEIRVLIESAGIKVTAPRWSGPGFVVCAGATYAPTREPGYLLVNGEPRYSAAWL